MSPTEAFTAGEWEREQEGGFWQGKPQPSLLLLPQQPKDDEERKSMWRANEFLRAFFRVRWPTQYQSTSIAEHFTMDQLLAVGSRERAVGERECLKLIRVPVIHEEVAACLWKTLRAEWKAASEGSTEFLRGTTTTTTTTNTRKEDGVEERVECCHHEEGEEGLSVGSTGGCEPARSGLAVRSSRDYTSSVATASMRQINKIKSLGSRPLGRDKQAAWGAASVARARQKARLRTVGPRARPTSSARDIGSSGRGWQRQATPRTEGEPWPGSKRKGGEQRPTRPRLRLITRALSSSYHPPSHPPPPPPQATFPAPPPPLLRESPLPLCGLSPSISLFPTPSSTPSATPSSTPSSTPLSTPSATPSPSPLLSSQRPCGLCGDSDGGADYEAAVTGLSQRLAAWSDTDSDSTVSPTEKRRSREAYVDDLVEGFSDMSPPAHSEAPSAPMTSPSSITGRDSSSSSYMVRSESGASGSGKRGNSGPQEPKPPSPARSAGPGSPGRGNWGAAFECHPGTPVDCDSIFSPSVFSLPTLTSASSAPEGDPGFWQSDEGVTADEGATQPKTYQDRIYWGEELLLNIGDEEESGTGGGGWAGRGGDDAKKADDGEGSWGWAALSSPAAWSKAIWKGLRELSDKGPGKDDTRKSSASSF